jgi:hypothetical protein
MGSSKTVVIGTDGCGIFSTENALRTEHWVRLGDDVTVIALTDTPGLGL